MRITYIQLVGFKRFPLRESGVFEHHFKSKLTMITGPNGAGKSSLFNELTPLPADKNNFNKGGFKEIHIDKDGKSYILTSSFKEATKYSFQCDGQELNLSGNVTTQKDLAQIHFSVTPTVHELMTGGESFTEMGLVSRKKLFNSITHMNIDSILTSFESLKEELRNNEFLEKSLVSRLVSEQHKLIDDNRKTQLTERLNSLRTHIEYLLSILSELHQYKSAPDLGSAIEHYRHASDQLQAHYRDNLIRLSAYPLERCDVLEAAHRRHLSDLSTQLQRLYTRMEKLLHEKTSIEFAQSANKESVEQEIFTLTQSSKNLIADLRIVDPQTLHLNDVSAELNMLERSLPEILESLPVNTDRKLSRAAHSALLEEKNTVLTQMHESLSERARVTAELTELNRHQSLQCPSCDHSWLPREIKGLMQTNQQRLVDISTRRLTLEDTMKALVPQLAYQANYLTQFQGLTALYSATKLTLGQLWKIVSEQELAHVNPNAIHSLVVQGISEVIDVQKYRAIQERLRTLKENLTHLEVAGTSSFAENTRAINVTEDEIACAMQTSQDVKEIVQDIQTSKKLHQQLTHLKQTTRRLDTQLRQANLKHLVNTLVREIDTELSLTKVGVMEVQNELSQHDAIHQTVKSLEGQVKDVQENVKVLSILTEELSPKNGFIAKTISHFLNVIIQSVNNVIAGVWDYKMVLKAIDVQSDNLNYRFKVEVEDRLTVDDVSKASAGMKEIINLAMKITLFKLLKLENYPMYLDEMASHLDTVHTGKIVNLIYKLTISDLYSQVFLITHKEDFSFLKNAEVIEL